MNLMPKKAELEDGRFLKMPREHLEQTLDHWVTWANKYPILLKTVWVSVACTKLDATTDLASRRFQKVIISRLWVLLLGSGNFLRLNLRASQTTQIRKQEDHHNNLRQPKLRQNGWFQRLYDAAIILNDGFGIQATLKYLESSWLSIYQKSIQDGDNLIHYWGNIYGVQVNNSFKSQIHPDMPTTS